MLEARTVYIYALIGIGCCYRNIQQSHHRMEALSDAREVIELGVETGFAREYLVTAFYVGRDMLWVE